MKTIKLGLLWFAVSLTFVLAACASCTPTPVPPTSDAALPDAGLETAPPALDAAPRADLTAACSAMCANLAKLGCTEGGASCQSECLLVQGKHTADLKPFCVADAGSPGDVTGCGGSASCTVPTPAGPLSAQRPIDAGKPSKPKQKE